MVYFFLLLPLPPSSASNHCHFHCFLLKNSLFNLSLSLSTITLWILVPPPPHTVSTCQPPIPPSNGRLLQGSGHFKAGDYVEFSCDPGFQLMGSSSSLSVCLENGSWSQSVPQCEYCCCLSSSCHNRCPAPHSLRVYTLFDTHVARKNVRTWTAVQPCGQAMA